MDRVPLDVARLRRWGRHSPLWREIAVHDSIDSTNSALAVLAGRGAAEGTVLAAESQTAGRGRSDRSWVSPPRAGITVSMLLRPPVPMARWSWLPLLTGIAVCEALTKSDVPVALKWPNDVLAGVHNRKLAGILAEVVKDAVVIGVGLNVSQRARELPRRDATSLTLEDANALDRTGLLLELLERTAHWYRQWCDAGADPHDSGLIAAYRSRCHTLGRQVEVSLPDGARLRGLAADIDADGRLCVDTATGRIGVAAGDVHHVR
jgi:BirA family biotin operon repressor/biotin-[acetyl-CoA-carboxylase] ligase